VQGFCGGRVFVMMSIQAGVLLLDLIGNNIKT
jgi:hypothetical protein